jgi:hypothetical protein
MDCVLSVDSSVLSVDGRDEADFIAAAILATLPQSTKDMNDCLFALGRRLKGISGFANLKASDPTLTRIVTDWYQEARPSLPDTTLVGIRAAFSRRWKLVHTAYGESLKAALAEAQQEPHTGLYDDDRVDLLLRLCRVLQRQAGDEPFYLSCRMAAHLVGGHFTETNAWLYVFIEDGHLQLVEKGGGKENPRKASRYRFTGPPA